MAVSLRTSVSVALAQRLCLDEESLEFLLTDSLCGHLRPASDALCHKGQLAAAATRLIIATAATAGAAERQLLLPPTFHIIPGHPRLAPPPADVGGGGGSSEGGGGGGDIWFLKQVRSFALALHCTHYIASQVRWAIRSRGVVRHRSRLVSRAV
jgi:hypothetical protein